MKRIFKSILVIVAIMFTFAACAKKGETKVVNADVAKMQTNDVVDVSKPMAKDGGELLVTTPDSQPHTLEGFGVELDPHFLSANVNHNILGLRADIDDWENIIVSRLKKMDIKLLRVMVLPSWYEPINDNSSPWGKNIKSSVWTWNSDKMKSLYLLLDTAEKLNITVRLAIWGPERSHFLSIPNEVSVWSAPSDVNEYVENMTALLEYLLTVKKYTCIKEFTPFNEPNLSYIDKDWLKYNDNFDTYADMCIKLDASLKRANIRHNIRLMLSDDSEPAKIEWLPKTADKLAKITDGYISHNYTQNQNSTNADNFARGKSYIDALYSYDKTKTHSYGEFGSSDYTGAYKQNDVGDYGRGILLASLATQFTNAGSSGMIHWTFFNQYYEPQMDYQMDCGLFKYKYDYEYNAQTLKREISQVNYQTRPAYYAWGLISKFTGSGYGVYPVTAINGDICGVVFRKSATEFTYFLVNKAVKEIKISFYNPRIKTVDNMKRYLYQEGALPETDDMITGSAIALKDNYIHDVVPANSFVVYSNIK